MSKNLPKIVPPQAMMRLPQAASWSGVSRSELYRAAASGRLILRKLGRSTLVDGESLAALISALPVAKIRPDSSRYPGS